MNDGSKVHEPAQCICNTEPMVTYQPGESPYDKWMCPICRHKYDFEDFVHKTLWLKGQEIEALREELQELRTKVEGLE